MRIYGKANDVFDTIQNICLRNPGMTLKEAINRGLLSNNLQDTKILTVGDYPYVVLAEGYEKN